MFSICQVGGATKLLRSQTELLEAGNHNTQLATSVYVCYLEQNHGLTSNIREIWIQGSLLLEDMKAF